MAPWPLAQRCSGRGNSSCARRGLDRTCSLNSTMIPIALFNGNFAQDSSGWTPSGESRARLVAWKPANHQKPGWIGWMRGVKNKAERYYPEAQAANQATSRNVGWWPPVCAGTQKSKTEMTHKSMARPSSPGGGGGRYYRYSGER